MQKTTVAVIEVLIVIIGISLIAYYKFYQAPRLGIMQPAPSSPPVLVDKSSYFLVSVKEQPSFTIIDVEYPYFENAPQSFNEKIKEYVFAKIKEHNSLSEANWKSRFGSAFEESNFPEKPEVEGDKMPFYMKTDVVQSNNQFISFTLHYATYQTRALFSEEILSFNFDLSKQKEITLEELFSNNPLYLQDISRFAKSDLEKQLVDTESLKDLGLTTEVQNTYVKNISRSIAIGTNPKISNFSTFTFTPESVTFYFQKTQVGPTSIGMPKVVMPRK